MRLIDADEYKKNIVREWEQALTQFKTKPGFETSFFYVISKIMTETIIKGIDEQPTVILERTGKWKEGEPRLFIDLSNAERQFKEL